MARSLNKAQLIGNVGNDPEVRSTTGGNRVATLSLATSAEWKNAAGEKQEKTQWHRLVVWGKLADIVAQYVKKGDRLYAEGRIEYRQWQDKDDNTRYSTEIVVESLLMLGARGESNGSARQRETAGTVGRVRDEMKSGDDFEDFRDPLEDEDDGLPF